MILFAFVAPFVPGLLWLWFFYTRDRYQPEPKRVVAWTFALGGLSAAPAILGEKLGESVFHLGDAMMRAVVFEGTVPLGTVAALCFLIIGPVEELCKFAAVRAFAARHRAFDEPLDGIIYASAAALGFASIENVLYIQGSESAGVGVLLLTLRALLAVPGHVFFAVIWGWALGRRLLPGYRWWYLPGALALSAFVHGAWDFTLLHPSARLFFLPLFGLMAWTIYRLMRWGRVNSPFHPARRGLVLAPGSTGRRCLRCGLTAGPDDGFCSRCGGRVLPLTLECPQCKAALHDRTDRFCASCGHSLDDRMMRCGLCRAELRDVVAEACPSWGGRAPAPPG